MAADPAGSTPTPDPTVLTTEQMLREVKNLGEFLASQIDNVETQASLRMTDLENRIKHGQDVHDERFVSVTQQFQERDIRAEQGAIASSKALDAALEAAKELVIAQATNQSLTADKAERAIAKQLDSLGERVQTEVKALNDKINEVKERLDRDNGSTVGGQAVTVDERAQRAEGRAERAERAAEEAKAEAKKEAADARQRANLAVFVSVLVAVLAPLIVIALTR